MQYRQFGAVHKTHYAIDRQKVGFGHLVLLSKIIKLNYDDHMIAIVPISDRLAGWSVRLHSMVKPAACPPVSRQDRPKLDPLERALRIKIILGRSLTAIKKRLSVE